MIAYYHALVLSGSGGMVWKVKFQKQNKEYLKRSVNSVYIICHYNNHLFVIYPELLEPNN